MSSVVLQKSIREGFGLTVFYLRATSARVKFISFEPLLSPINTNLNGIDWLIIGSQTRPTKIPKKEWVHTLIDQARDLNIPVFLKDNLHWSQQIQEFPNEKYNWSL
jgi:protein gp37